MASNEQDVQTIFDSISGYIKEYVIKVNGKSQKWFVLMEWEKKEEMEYQWV